MAAPPMSVFDKSAEAAAAIRKAVGDVKLDLWIILGSGLGDFAKNISNPTVLPYRDIPHFPTTTIVGHVGELVVGELGGKRVVTQRGRWHTYEGHDASTVVLGVRVMHHLGIKQMIVTNAAGGVNLQFKAGNLMLMTDHINLMNLNPLIGPNDDRFGTRFPDMSAAYNPELLDMARRSAKEAGVHVVEGVYAALRGPNYETPAEIRYLRAIGADAVGMSTAPEVLAANHQGARVLGISCITNMAAGVLKQKLEHKEVELVARSSAEDFTKLLITIIKNM